MDPSNLTKLYVLLVLSVARLHKTDAGCPSKEWTQYKEEKCIRVLDLLSNHQDAELTCREQNSTLLSITSLKEQEFLRQLLFSDFGTVDNVWLGAVRVNSTTFRWTDGSPWTFDNWKEGSPSDVEGNGCVQMLPQGGRQDKPKAFDLNTPGLWSDVTCGKRNLVVCQKRPTLSLDELTARFFHHLQTSEALHAEQEMKLADAFKELEAQKIALEEANLKILQVEKNPVPLGFVYTQLSGQPEPLVIWPSVTWTQVTQDYKGLFFRAEGGNSSIFGQVQNDQSPRLSRVVFTFNDNGVWNPRDISVPERGASAAIFTGEDRQDVKVSHVRRWFLTFHNSGGEVRPKNQAIRLWKRTA